MKVELTRSDIEAILMLISRAGIQGSEAQAVVVIQAKLGAALQGPTAEPQKPRKGR